MIDDIVEAGKEGLEYLGIVDFSDCGVTACAGEGIFAGHGFSGFSALKGAGIFGIGGIGFSALGPIILLIVALGAIMWYLNARETEEEASTD
ncbi:hypothetical protein WDW89_21475 [Deltaproteobacteria bacterium TL4]